MTGVRRRIVKLGGSLFSDPRLPQMVRQWLQANRADETAIVVGGGLWADGVRDAFARFDLTETFCHWLCINLLEQTSSLASELLHMPCIDQWKQLPFELAKGEPVVFCCSQYLREIEPMLSESPLPHDWTVTTDSIAARLAEHTSADELVLWKSTMPPEGATDPRAWREADYVDEFFPVAARGLTVRAVDLASGRQAVVSGESTTSE